MHTYGIQAFYLSALVLFIVFSLIPNLTWLTVCIFFIGFAIVFVYVPFFTVAQETTENHIMGRVMSLIFLAMNGFDPIAYGIVAGLVATGIPIQHVLTGLGAAGLIIWLIVFSKAVEFKRA